MLCYNTFPRYIHFQFARSVLKSVSIHLTFYDIVFEFGFQRTDQSNKNLVYKHDTKITSVL